MDGHGAQMNGVKKPEVCALCQPMPCKVQNDTKAHVHKHTGMLTWYLPMQPLSLEELLKKRKAEQEDLAKVRRHTT